MSLEEIRQAAEAEGLSLTGWFHPQPDDKAPQNAETILLFGYGGPALWAAFKASPEATDGMSHGLDRWSRRVVTALAAAFGGEALFPFGGPPHQPFIRWIYAGEPLHQSRLGMSIHPDRGLWSGWRGAIALSRRLALPDRFHSDQSGEIGKGDPCDPCPAPCLTACPVNAFTDAGYDAAACRAHLNSPEGAPCRAAGCLARRACPVGKDFAHSAEQAAFHLEAFRVA